MMELLICIAVSIILSILGGWIFALWIWSIFIATLLSSYYVRVAKRSDAILAMYVIYLALSQIIAAKIVKLTILDYTFIVPAAVLIFPFTVQLTDMVNEYFGRMETHRMIFIAFVTQVLMSFFLWMSVIMTPFEMWMTELGGPEVGQKFWETIFFSSIRITIASWTSFLIVENLDAIVFAKIREITGQKHLWIRSVFSDVPMLALDSFIFVTLAFYGVVPLDVIFLMIYGQVMTKWFSGVIDTPFIYLERWVVESDFSWLRKLPIRFPFMRVKKFS